jgi:cysteine synthase A
MNAIGKTPLIKLERLSEPNCAEIYVKYEGANPTGSIPAVMDHSMTVPLKPAPF